MTTKKTDAELEAIARARYKAEHEAMLKEQSDDIQELLLVLRRALLMIVVYIERRYSLTNTRG